MRKDAGRVSGGRWIRGTLLATALLFCFNSGCAYFNTFYFAKKWYGEAETTRKKSESDKLPPDAEKKYEDAIAQCRKVVRDHPNSRWADDAVYLMGASYYGRREYEKALDTFDDLLASYERSKFVPWAHYMKGLCYFERREYPAMKESFDQALALKPDFERKDEILFTFAQAAEKERNRPEAVRRYRELTRVFRGSEQSDEALLHIGALYFDAGRYDSAATSYDELARVTRNDKTYQEAQIRRAETLGRLGQSDAAIELLRPLLPKDERQNRSADEFPARVRLEQARAFNNLGRYDEALERLRGVVTLYPASNYSTEAQFQIGYTYEVYLDSLESARKAYDQASKMSAKSVFREQAQSRLNSLNQLQELTSSASDSSNTDRENQATAKLKIAELYLFSQEKTGEALAKYREVLQEFPETKAAPRAAYGVAWIRLKKMEGKSDSAYADLASLIRAYPASRQAHAALDLLADQHADTVGLSSLLEESKPETLETPVPEPPPVDSLAQGRGVSRLSGDVSDSTGGMPFDIDDPRLARARRDSLLARPGVRGRRLMPGMEDSLVARPTLGDSTASLPIAPDSATIERFEPSPIDTSAILDSLRRVTPTPPESTRTPNPPPKEEP